MGRFCPAQAPPSVRQKESVLQAVTGPAQSRPGLLDPCVLQSAQKEAPRVTWPSLLPVHHSEDVGSLPPPCLCLELASSRSLPHRLLCRPPFEHLSPVRALLSQGAQGRKTVCCLVKLVQLGTWLQGLLWQPEQMIREKAAFPVGVWRGCLCAHMGVCSTEEKNDITTKNDLATPYKASGLPHKPCPLFPGEWTPGRHCNCNFKTA